MKKETERETEKKVSTKKKKEKKILSLMRIAYVDFGIYC